MSENKEKSAFHNFIDDSFFSYQFLTFGLIFGVAGSALIIVGAVLGTQLNKNTVSDFVNGNTLSQNSQALSYWQNPGVEVLTYTIPNVNIDSVAGGNITCGSSVTTTYSLQLNRVNLTFSADGNSVDYRLQRLVTPEATSANFTVNTLDLGYLYAVNSKGDEPTLANTIDTSVKGFKSVGDFFNTKLTGIFGAQKVASGIAKSITDTYPAILTQFATDYYNAALEYPMKRVAGTLFAGPVVSGLLSGCGSTAAAACAGLASNTPTATCSSASFYSIFNTFAKTSTNACTAVLSLGSAAPELLFSKSTQLYLCKTPATLLTTLQKTVAAITLAEVNTLCTTSLPKLISDYNATQTNVYSVLDSVTKDNTGILPNKNPSIPIGLDVINSVNGEQGILKLANPPASVAGLTVDYIKADANIQAFVAQNTDFFKKWYSVLLWASNSTRTTTQSFTGLAVNTNLTNSVMQLVSNATLDAKVTSFLPGLLFDSANAAYLQVGGAIDTKTLEPFPTLGAAGNVLGIATGSSSVASSIASVPSITSYISSLIQSYTDTTQQALGQLLYANAYPDGIMKAFFSTPYLPSVELGLVINNTNYFNAADHDEWLANKNGSKNTLSGTLATLGNANPFLSVGTGSLTAKYMRYIYYNIYLKLVTDNLSGNTGGVAAVTFGAAINQKLVSTLLNKADNGKVNTLIGFQIPNAAGWEPLTTTTIDTAYYTDLTGANGSKSAYQSATAGFDGFEYHFAPDFVQTGKSLTFLSTANSQINTLPVQCVGTVSDSIYSTDAVQCQYAKPSTLPTKNSYLQEITTSASNAVIAARFLVPCELASSLFNATAPMCSAGFDSNQHGTFVNVQSATGMTLSARTCFLSVSEITVPGTTLSAPSLANKQIVTNDYMRLSTYLGTSAQINAFTGSVNDANAKSRAILIALVVVGAVLFAVSIPLFVFYGIKKSRANKATAKEDLVKDPFHEMNDRFARVAA